MHGLITGFVIPYDTLELLLVDGVEADWASMPFGMIRSVQVMKDARVAEDVTALR